MRTLVTVLFLSAFLCGPGSTLAQDLSEVEIEVQHVAGPVHMLQGRGGNIGVFDGPDGLLLIDDQYAPLTAKIRAAAREIDDESIRFVINTHWHGDHTGGNENLGRGGSVIVAHDNVRERMSVEQLIDAWDATVPESPPTALPLVTFTESVTFHLGEEEIHAFHVEAAHTDGDTIVHFQTSNVIHMGDTMFNGLYPFIDYSTGGTVQGVLAAVDRVLELAGPETKIIPGHGPLADRDDLIAYRDMLAGVFAEVAPLVATGKTREEVLAAHPTARWDEAWGQGFLNPDKFTGIVFECIQRAR